MKAFCVDIWYGDGKNQQKTHSKRLQHQNSPKHVIQT